MRARWRPPAGPARPRPPLPRVLRLRLLTVALLLLTAAAWSLGPDPGSIGRASLSTWVVLIVIFGLAEATQIHIELQRQTYSLSLSELPLVLALFTLPPAWVLSARLIGASYVFLWRRTAPDKAAYNLSLFALEVCVAVALFNALGSPSVIEPVSWLAAYAAVSAADIVGVFAVIAAIASVQNRLGYAEVVGILVPTVLAATLNTTLGLLVLLVLAVTEQAVVLLLLVAAVVVAAYRAYSVFARRHETLGAVYEFTRAVEAARDDDRLPALVLSRIRALLRAESASLWLPGGDGAAAVTLTVSADGSINPVLPWAPRPGSPALLDPLRALVMAEGTPLLVSAHRAQGFLDQPDADEHRAWLREQGIGEAIVTRLRAGTTVVGLLQVNDRQGELSSFGAEDLQLLETLAAHVSASLENSQLLQRLRHEAYSDPLTGLPNRSCFSATLTATIETIAEARDQPERGAGSVAVLLLDLDGFREVNDTLGHVAGDRLLIEVGRRLAARAPAGSLVSRVGGDEFAVLLPGYDDAAACEIAASLQAVLDQSFAVDELALDVGVCIGIAVYPQHADDAVALLQRADVAMYAAKDTHRTVQLYRPSLDRSDPRRLGLVAELRRAMDAGEIVVHYQPKVALATRELVGVEALVRWQHPVHGMVSPDDFVPIAEHTGLIGPLTTLVLSNALARCRSWLEDSRRLGVAVNLSVRSLLDASFPDHVASLLLAHDVPPSLLTLEITESSVMSDPDRALPVLHRLHEMGVGLSVDDFGTGYSSLAYLRRLPVDEVKIDKSFVLNMGTDLGDLAIVRAIIDLGRNLGLRVVAEGVEDEMSRDMLDGMQCDVVQGYLLSRPISGRRLDSWINSRTLPTAAPASGTPRRLTLLT